MPCLHSHGSRHKEKHLLLLERLGSALMQDVMMYLFCHKFASEALAVNPSIPMDAAASGGGGRGQSSQ